MNETKYNNTRLAQSVERRTFNPVVEGSSPSSSAVQRYIKKLINNLIHTSYENVFLHRVSY